MPYSLSHRRAARTTGAWLLVVAGLVAGLSTGCRAQGQPSLKDEFRKLLIGGRQPSPLNPEVVSTMDVEMNRVERVRFTPEPGHDAVALIYRPKAEGKYPAIVVQHFLGGTKEEMKPLIGPLAQKGFVVAAIDGRYRGDRKNGKDLQTAMLESLRSGKGHPFLLDTAYDVTRLIDYLQSRPDVDPTRIGMTGVSEGGIITWMVAAADDRVKVAAPVIGVTAFGTALQKVEAVEAQAKAGAFSTLIAEYGKDIGEKDPAKVLRAAWDKLVPGMLDRFDAPHLVPLIAPRALLISSHELDELFPLDGAKLVVDAARARYKEGNAEDRLQHRVSPGLTHAQLDFFEFLSVAAWLERWLKMPEPGN